MTKNIWPVMPIMMIGSSVASIPSLMFGVHDPAPHGGFLVLPVVENAPMWVLAIAIGTVVGGILFVAFKKREWTKARRPPRSKLRRPRPQPSMPRPSRPPRRASSRPQTCSATRRSTAATLR